METIVYRSEFVEFPGAKSKDDPTPFSKITRGRSWRYAIQRFSIDQVGTHERPAIRRLFDGEVAEHTPLRFKDHPVVDREHDFIDHDAVNGLVVESLRTFIDGINSQLDEHEAQAAKEKVMRTKVGLNAGPLVIAYLHQAADHFLEHPPVQAA